MSISRRIVVPRRTLPHQFGEILRDARRAMGWTQDELASRASTSQTRILRLERGDPSAFNPAVLDDVLEALGVRLTARVDARHLDDRARQRDAVHARLVETVASRLERCAWQVLTEVPVGGDPPRGWVDILAHREADQAVAVGEMKTVIRDAGELQRQLTYYAREAVWAARRAGWNPRLLVPFAVALDTQAVAATLRDNARLIRRAFPGDPGELAAWLSTPAAPKPEGATIVVADLAQRRSLGLRASAAHARIRTAPYLDYADAAASMRRRRRRC